MTQAEKPTHPAKDDPKQQGEVPRKRDDSDDEVEESSEG